MGRVLIRRVAALPFPYTFAAGAIAGCTELLCLYPLGMFQESYQGIGMLTIIHRHHQDPDAARDRQGPAWDRRNAQGDRRQGRVSCDHRVYGSSLIEFPVLLGCTEVSSLP